PTYIYTLSLHDALPIYLKQCGLVKHRRLRSCAKLAQLLTQDRIPLQNRAVSRGRVILRARRQRNDAPDGLCVFFGFAEELSILQDRKSTRLNSSHVKIS